MVVLYVEAGVSRNVRDSGQNPWALAAHATVICLETA
jgi:hypothetical protein